ncbi:MAG: hypothetical protein U0325_11645 [Polyangiales bacterium]
MHRADPGVAPVLAKARWSCVVISDAGLRAGTIVRGVTAVGDENTPRR